MTQSREEQPPDVPSHRRPRWVTKIEIDERLFAHARWLESGKKEGTQFQSGSDEYMTGQYMQRANLSGAMLWRATLSNAILHGADLSGADLLDADLRSVKLQEANLIAAKMNRANLSRANLREADLSRANLFETNLSGADLRHANVAGANVRGAKLPRTQGLYGPDRAANLATVKNAEHAVYGLPLDFAHWALLRFIGTLHLFSASYIAFVAITVYATAMRWHNQHVPLWHAWAREHDSWSDGLVRFFAGLVLRIPVLPVQSHFGLLLLAIGLLAIATTLHAVFCPEAIKEATETRWTRELNQPLIEYRSAMYHRFWVRYITLISFGLGGLYTLGYLLWRASRALWYLLAV